MSPLGRECSDERAAGLVTTRSSVLRLAVVAESRLDEAVARAIVAHVRGEAPALVELRERPPGVSALLRRLPAILRQAYLHTDANAVVVLADGDLTDPHSPVHEGQPDPGCRWCALHAAADTTLARFPPLAGRSPLRVAIGVAVPAVEAWLLAGRGVVRSEAEWIVARHEGRFQSVRESLKRQAYGGAVVTTGAAIARALPLLDVALSSGVLVSAFPGGYGPLEAAIRAW